MTNEQKAISLLMEIPDDMDYPTDQEFRLAFNDWYEDQIRPFLKAIRASEDGKERYRHKKRGTIYSVLFAGYFQSSDLFERDIDDTWLVNTYKPLDSVEVIIYQSIDDKKVWVRPKDEFFDGRFEKVT